MTLDIVGCLCLLFKLCYYILHFIRLFAWPTVVIVKYMCVIYIYVYCICVYFTFMPLNQISHSIHKINATLSLSLYIPHIQTYMNSRFLFRIAIWFIHLMKSHFSFPDMDDTLPGCIKNDIYVSNTSYNYTVSIHVSTYHSLYTLDRHFCDVCIQ